MNSAISSCVAFMLGEWKARHRDFLRWEWQLALVIRIEIALEGTLVRKELDGNDAQAAYQV